MVCKFNHNFKNFFVLPLHIFPFMPSFVLLSVFPIYFDISVKAVVHKSIFEDIGVSPLTEKTRSVSTMSSILDYIHTTRHQILHSDFKILSTAISEADSLIRESLFISKLIPTLNANISSTLLDLF